MNNLLKSILLLSAFQLLQVSMSAATITLSDGDNVSASAPNTYTVPAGHLATVGAHVLKGTSAELRVYNDQLVLIARIRASSLVGDLILPAGYKIQTLATSSEDNSLALAQLTVSELATGSSYVPHNAVVIPTDATGPVSIILESSTDLLTWSPATAGTYGTTTEQRFFRVRAVATP